MISKPKLKDGRSDRTSLELLYNISREVAAALDLRTVLQRVLFLTMKNVGGISGSIIVLDANGQPIESAIITGAQIHDQTTHQLRATFERGLAGWVIRNNKAVLVPDTSRDERWLRRPDDAEDQTGSKSAVSAPIKAHEDLVGVMTLVHPTPGFFNLDHVELVQAIADQAGIAILNARLYEESQGQARVMTAIAESAAAINASLNLEDVLQRILEQIGQALRVEVVFLALIDAESRQLVFRASSGGVGERVAGMMLGVGQGIAGWVAMEGRGVVVPDVENDPRFERDFYDEIGIKVNAIACAPIRSRGQIIGILQAVNPTARFFDPDALVVLTGIGSLAGTAIHHAQLFERVEATHQRYRELFEDSIDPILITDWAGHILEANRQAALLTGIENQTLRRMSIDSFQVVDHEKVGSQFNQLSGGVTQSYESSLLTKTRGEIPVQVYAREVLIDGISHLQWIIRDISERKYIDNLRNDLLSMIYHDLRSPLANIVSSLDVLATMLPLSNDPAMTSLFSIAIRSTERIQRLTNSLLDMRRLEAGRPIGDRQYQAVGSLIRESVDAVTLSAESKKQSISIEAEPDLPKLYIDTDMIRRVLINLLENAIKYTPVGSDIFLGVKNIQEMIEIWVQDNGPGIPVNEQERIFDKFTRLHTNDGPKGLGLGLAFCRLAIEKHGGEIWVENIPKSGARFSFRLPVNTKEPMPEKTN
jgi:PAS domain S-box-containing protein